MTVEVDKKRAIVDLRRREPNYVAAMKSSPRLGELGAGDYYMLRLRNNFLLPQPEWDVLKYIFQNYPTDSTIVEIGCGWGQLLAMASVVGYAGIGIDVSVGRLEGARKLRDIIDADFAGAGGRLEFFE